MAPWLSVLLPNQSLKYVFSSTLTSSSVIDFLARWFRTIAIRIMMSDENGPFKPSGKFARSDFVEDLRFASGFHAANLSGFCSHAVASGTSLVASNCISAVEIGPLYNVGPFAHGLKLASKFACGRVVLAFRGRVALSLRAMTLARPFRLVARCPSLMLSPQLSDWLWSLE
jgi:hypothetical protein